MRDPTSALGPAGAGAGIAAFLLVRTLALNLEKSGQLSRDDLQQMLTAAIEALGNTPNAVRQDAKDLLTDLHQQLLT